MRPCVFLGRRDTVPLFCGLFTQVPAGRVFRCGVSSLLPATEVFYADSCDRCVLTAQPAQLKLEVAAQGSLAGAAAEAKVRPGRRSEGASRFVGQDTAPGVHRAPEPERRHSSCTI